MDCKGKVTLYACMCSKILILRLPMKISHSGVGRPLLVGPKGGFLSSGLQYIENEQEKKQNNIIKDFKQWSDQRSGLQLGWFY